MAKITDEQRAFAAQLRTLADQAAERARLDAEDAIRIGAQLAEERKRNPDPVDLHNRALQTAEWAQRSHDLAIGAEERARAAETPIAKHDAAVRARAAHDEAVEQHLRKLAHERTDRERISFEAALREIREERARGSWRLPGER